VNEVAKSFSIRNFFSSFISRPQQPQQSQQPQPQQPQQPQTPITKGVGCGQIIEWRYMAIIPVPPEMSLVKVDTTDIPIASQEVVKNFEKDIEQKISEVKIRLDISEKSATTSSSSTTNTT